jgi:hypothetical protein
MKMEDLLKNLAGKPINRWNSLPEKTLWELISVSDGMHCPLSTECPTQKRGMWCPEVFVKEILSALDGEDSDMDRYFWVGNEEKPFCKMFDLVEGLAYKYLAKAKVTIPPISMDLIHTFDPDYLIQIREVPLNAYHGAIWHFDHEWIIQIRSYDSIPLKRYTAFHEAFHILAHLRSKPKFSNMKTDSQFNELLAGYFSACLLMPRNWFIKKWFEFNDVCKLASFFNAPKSAACIRLIRLNLVDLGTREKLNSILS